MPPLEPSGSGTKVCAGTCGGCHSPRVAVVSASVSTRDLRRRLRAARRALGSSEQRGHARALARSLGKQAAFLRARRVGVYWSADGEIDPFPLLGLAHARHKRCFLPVLRPHPQRKLWFLEYRPNDPLKKNHFGIPEPRLRNRRIRLPWALDLLLLPLVGFDPDCNRLGMGGGYYDRTLCYLLRRSYWRRPLLVGLAHECQRVEILRPNPWDVPLNIVATEERIYVAKREHEQLVVNQLSNVKLGM